MGKLFPYAKGRLGAGESAIAHFKEAAKADISSSLVWEMLGEMLAFSDPPGQLQTPYLTSPSRKRYFFCTECSYTSGHRCFWRWVISDDSKQMLR